MTALMPNSNLDSFRLKASSDRSLREGMYPVGTTSRGSSIARINIGQPRPNSAMGTLNQCRIRLDEDKNCKSHG